MARFDIRTRKTALRYALENGYVVDASVLNSSMAHMPTRPFTPDLRERLAEYLRLTPLNPARRKQAHRAAGVRLAVEVRSQKHLNENSELQIYLLRFLDGEPLQEKGAPKGSVNKLMENHKLNMFALSFFHTLKEQAEHGKPLGVPQLADSAVTIVSMDCVVPDVRLERTTYRLQGGCSTS